MTKNIMLNKTVLPYGFMEFLVWLNIDILSDTTGSTEGITSMEYAMEHMARHLKMDPLEFRKLNMIPDGGMRLANTAPVKLREILSRYNVIRDHGMTPFLVEKNYLPAMLEQIEANAEIEDRKSQVADFNNVRYFSKLIYNNIRCEENIVHIVEICNALLRFSG